MQTSQTATLAHRQAIYQTFVEKEATQAKSAEKSEAIEAHRLPVEQANPSLPDHVGGTVNVRV